MWLTVDQQTTIAIQFTIEISQGPHDSEGLNTPAYVAFPKAGRVNLEATLQEIRTPSNIFILGSKLSW